VTSGHGPARAAASRQVAAGLIHEAIAAATSWDRPGREFILVRHGQPLPEDQRSAAELLDPPLSRLGQRQAEAAGFALGGERIQAICASPLARARDTARIIAAAVSLPVTSRPDLREIELFRDAGVLAETVSQPADEDSWRAAAARFASSGRWDCWPAAEPASTFRQRVRAVISDITSQPADGTAAIVCHNGVINACLADALGLERDYLARPLHASLTRLRLSAGRLQVTSLNETGHLAPELLTG
jgi:probable phosphoglycerate mutase